MTIHDVSAYLTRFDAPPPIIVGDAAVEPASLPEDEGGAPEAPPPPIDADKLRAEMEAEFSAALAAEQESFARKLQEARERWIVAEAEALRNAVTQSLEAAIESLRADLARILTPFVSREIAQRALDETIASVRQALANEHAPAIQVSGPSDLLDRISAALSADNVVLSLSEREGVDARVTFASTTIETRLGDWMRRLSNERASDR